MCEDDGGNLNKQELSPPKRDEYYCPLCGRRARSGSGIDLRTVRLACSLGKGATGAVFQCDSCAASFLVQDFESQISTDDEASELE